MIFINIILQYLEKKEQEYTVFENNLLLNFVISA